jgi:cobalamin biosynthesis protein CobT
MMSWSAPSSTNAGLLVEKRRWMSISNRKPGDRKEAPNEPIKRSIAGAMRALARQPDLEVTYASDRPL